MRDQLDENFKNTIDWLLEGAVDFDFLCEATLPTLCKGIGERLAVGQMSYSAVVIPPCETLRGTTVEILRKFIEAGGKVVFAGDPPRFVDAEPSLAAQRLEAQRIPFTRFALLSALDGERQIELRGVSGKQLRQFVYQMRADGKDRYLFLANAKPPLDTMNNSKQPPTKAIITVRGRYIPTVLNTLTGQEEAVHFVQEKGNTAVCYDFYENDSLLLRLTAGEGAAEVLPARERRLLGWTDIKTKVEYRRQEDNVCLLDLAEYALDDGPFEPLEEILRIDKILRERFGWPLATGQDMQPWAMEKEAVSHYVTLRFTFQSRLEAQVSFCAEAVDALWCNGEAVTLREAGYFVDKSIKTYALPPLAIGENTVTVRVPFTKHESLEACYLTGDFNLRLEGCEKTLLRAESTVGFGDITHQGMPFYGGNLTYRTVIDLPQACDLCINASKYKGAFVRVYMDGAPMGNIVFAPYDLEIAGVSAGKHEIEFVLFGNRHNTFGGLHNCGPNIYYGQHYWYSTEHCWSYEYNIKPTGLLKSPTFCMYECADGPDKFGSQ